MNYTFETKMEVRDYECDIQGIVNNANYLHYLEHTRHRLLTKAGLSFRDMHEKGVDPVVARIELRYKAPLRCDDIMISRLWLGKKGPCFVFHQDLYRESDQQLCLRAVTELVVLVNGKIGYSKEYDEALSPFIPKKDAPNE
ncbi:MAG: acyl-CoA thioesterase [Prevotella sp.]|jgi:acyl-CoA thioester hydrolase|nr:acyl-CoA thioesterase [Prevotella sp.]MCH3986289.1 acyl-CoA thioesterase [Prevotella sp.]MCH4183375.1 acyl-CoA thioesterase [Prevotella sp.]MCH4213106.1 acyl-CoA thioesterase [Prevotella sp.]MCH4242226.1 acyl-CoA thioesterase [Prevotella sp.]MCI1742525.1 acyl-CoA thioesterase [Prevotella sp.]